MRIRQRVQRWVLIAFLFGACTPALAGTLQWDPVTTDVEGFPELGVITYQVYSRPYVHAGEPWVLLGETIDTSYPLPTPSARQEYTVTATDEAGNVSDMAVPVSAHPETPRNVKVNR